MVAGGGLEAEHGGDVLVPGNQHVVNVIGPGALRRLELNHVSKAGNSK